MRTRRHRNDGRQPEPLQVAAITRGLECPVSLCPQQSPLAPTIWLRSLGLTSWHPWRAGSSEVRRPEAADYVP